MIRPEDITSRHADQGGQKGKVAAGQALYVVGLEISKRDASELKLKASRDKSNRNVTVVPANALAFQLAMLLLLSDLKRR